MLVSVVCKSQKTTGCPFKISAKFLSGSTWSWIVEGGASCYDHNHMPTKVLHGRDRPRRTQLTGECLEKLQRFHAETDGLLEQRPRRRSSKQQRLE